MKVVSLSDLRTGRFYPQEMSLVLIFNFLEAVSIMQIKNFNDTIGNRTRDLPVLGQCLNKLRHRIEWQKM
jgi:hypothetical protein